MPAFINGGKGGHSWAPLMRAYDSSLSSINPHRTWRLQWQGWWDIRGGRFLLIKDTAAQEIHYTEGDWGQWMFWRLFWVLKLASGRQHAWLRRLTSQTHLYKHSPSSQPRDFDTDFLPCNRSKFPQVLWYLHALCESSNTFSIEYKWRVNFM